MQRENFYKSMRFTKRAYKALKPVVGINLEQESRGS